MCKPRLNHMWDMTFLMCVTWLLHMWDMTPHIWVMIRSYVRHDSFIHVCIAMIFFLIGTAVVSTYVRCASFICETWLVHICIADVAIVSWHTSRASHELLLCHVCETWLICYVRHDSFICETWIVHAWDMTHLYMCIANVAIVSRTPLASNVVLNLQIHMCDTTPSYVLRIYDMTP